LFDISVAAAVARVRERDPLIHAFITTRLEEALADARALAKERPRSSLHAVPYSLKDEWETKALATTSGSARYRARISTESSSLHQAFEAAGAVLVGKSNLSDLGIGPEASSYVGATTRNPHDFSRTAGGSSGGAAAAVADGMVGFDWGSDIGGSIRMPAAFCGIFGLRLSSQTWPITGFFPEIPASIRWLCGQGPLTRTLEQMRCVLDAARPIRTGASRPFTLRGLQLWIPDELGEWPSFARDVGPALARVARDVRTDHRLPGTTYVRNVFHSVWASHLEDLLATDTFGLWEGCGAVASALLFRGRLGDQRIYPTTAELLALIALGRYTIYRDPKRAIQRANAVKAQVEAIWDRGELIAMPTCVFSAPRVGRANYYPHLLSCTVPGNVADATGLAIPFGCFSNGLPRSIQLLGPPGSERLLLQVATDACLANH
jgi:Asp-tRNA(Asn)/Glu-tRNA(Gln) amidotransferase A subunit family amidase